MQRRRVILGAAGGAALLAPAALASPRAEVPLLTTYVAGIGHHGGAAEAARLAVGEGLALRRRPDSAYDPQTVEVWTGGGVLLGHVPRIDAGALASLMDAGFATPARVRHVSAHPTRPTVRLDVALEVGRRAA